MPLLTGNRCVFEKFTVLGMADEGTPLRGADAVPVA